MGYVPKLLCQFSRGLDLNSKTINTQVWLKNRKNSAIVLFVSNMLKIPSVQATMRGLKPEVYLGQRSNVDKWTVKQRLAFLIDANVLYHPRGAILPIPKCACSPSSIGPRTGSANSMSTDW